MNARQKAKKLKKELEELKADKKNGSKWLKIDGIIKIREEPRLWFDNLPIILNYIPNIYEVRIGHTTVEIKLEDPKDRLIVIDSKEFDKAVREIERQGVIL